MKLSFILADQEDFVKCVAFGEKFRNTLIEGQSIAMQNYIYREGSLRILNQTNILRHGKITIPEEVMQKARSSLDLPVTPVVPITAVKKSPMKSKVSFSGHIVGEEPPKKIRTRRGYDVMLRNLSVQDGSDKIRVSLWQESAQVDVVEGLKVVIKDAVVGQNPVQNEVSVSINSVEDIQVVEGQEPDDEVMVISAVQDEDPDIAMLNDNNGKLYRASRQTALLGFGASTVDGILHQLPISIRCRCLYERIFSLTCIASPEPPVEQEHVQTSVQEDDTEEPQGGATGFTARP